MNRYRISKAAILSDVRALARSLNHSPSSVEYARSGRYDVRTVQRKFKLKWPEIINSAGLRYVARTSAEIAPTSELKRDVLRVLNELAAPPTKKEYDERGKFDSQVIMRRTGKNIWIDALISLTGLNPPELTEYRARRGCYRSTSEWLSKLNALAKELGHAPTTAEANASGINARSLCKRVGGNWSRVLEAAGIDLRQRKRYAILRETATETMVSDLVALSHRFGRPAKFREYASLGHYSAVALRGRIGSWRRLRQIVARRLADHHNQIRVSTGTSRTSSESAVLAFFSPEKIRSGSQCCSITHHEANESSTQKRDHRLKDALQPIVSDKCLRF